MIDAYHRIAKSQRELQSKLERPPTTQEIAAATGIEAEKAREDEDVPVRDAGLAGSPDLRRDGRRLIDVLVDPNEGRRCRSRWLPARPRRRCSGCSLR
jgi:DNA-directed RNA polymerase sigma subunit (sigma70/sigma32)